MHARGADTRDNDRMSRTAADAGDRHWASRASSPAAVAVFDRAALASGGRDNSGVAERPEYHPHYYAALL